jgi:hypothetical protein
MQDDMANTPEDPVREDRITMQIVVDAYNPSEVAMGWYCYLENELTFPFEAVCNTRRATSPLKKGQVVEVVSMADSEECDSEMFVEIEFVDQPDDDDDDERAEGLAVPLSQLTPLDADPTTQRAVDDWHYWTARGYTLS